MAQVRLCGTQSKPTAPDLTGPPGLGIRQIGRPVLEPGESWVYRAHTSRAHSVKRNAVDDLPPILIVEDEALVLLTIAEALEEGGYTVLQASNGAMALELIERSDNLRGLVTDIRLGSGPNGWEVAHQARLKFPCLAVVYATGDSATEWSANGVPQSAILQKPFASAEI